VSHFLCQASDSRLNNATAILRVLVYLVMAQQPLLLRYLRSRYESTGRQLFEGPDAVFSLSEMLLGLLQNSDLPEIYFIVDAIGGYKKNLPQLLSFIKRSATANAKVKWIISSRNRDDIEQYLGSFERLASASQFHLIIDLWLHHLRISYISTMLYGENGRYVSAQITS